MRRIALFILVAVVLSVATRAAWNRLHLRAGEAPLVSAPDGTPALAPGEARQIDLPGIGTAGGIHLDFRLEAHDLTCGPDDWQAGRMLWQWIRDGLVVDEIHLGAVCADEIVTETSVILPAGPSRVSGRLHIENLGVSGTCRLLDLEAFSTTRSRAALLTLLGITGGWLVWAAALAGPLHRPASWLAAAVWMSCAFQIVLPGPWPVMRPLVGDSMVDSSPAAAPPLRPSSFRTTEIRPGETEPSNLLLRWKLRLKPLRPVLHGLLFFAPALVLLILTASVARAVGMTAALAAMVELAQWAFGYGFDWVDVLDLLTDALGIGLAVWVFGFWRRRTRTPDHA